MTPRLLVPLLTAAVMAPALAHAKTHAVDVNGDGLGDIVAAEPGEKGRFHVYFGRAGALSAKPDQTIGGPIADPNFDITELIGLGDINGDGFGDVLVHTTVGASVYLGSKTGLLGSPSIALTTPDGETDDITWNALGDVNGDGFADLGATVDCVQEMLEMSAPVMGQPPCKTDKEHYYVWLGSKTGLAHAPSLAVDEAQSDFHAFGVGVGDVDGDGKADVIRRHAGVIELFLGTSTGLSTKPAAKVAIKGVLIDQIASAGDVDNDGHDDVVLIGWIGDRTFAYLLRGDATGLVSKPAARFSVIGGYGGVFGRAGDLDADGRDDVVFGDIARAFVRRGARGGIASRSTVIKQPRLAHGRIGNFGFPVGSPGDVDGDGKADLVIGAPVSGSPIGGDDIGRVFVYRGGALAKPFAQLTGLDGTLGGDFGLVIATAPP